MINYIRYKDINKERWDQCIDKACNGIIFAYSWYLDAVCEEWDALIEEDYLSIMPLPRRRKWTIDYIYTPFFLNQLGVFSVKAITGTKVYEFLRMIPSFFQYIDLELHESNIIDSPDFKIERKDIQKVDLSRSYDDIYNDYSDNLKRNLKKAGKHNLKIETGIAPEKVIDIFIKEQGTKLKVFKAKDYENLTTLLNTLITRGAGETIGIYTMENELIAAASFMTSHSTIIYLKGAATEKGKQLGAMHYLMDYYIRTHSGKNLIFDFGGSSVPSLARFNHSFGSKDHVYLRILKNNLPKFVHWIKN